MIIKNTSFEGLKRTVSIENKKIVIFGAGVIGAVTTASIIVDYGLHSFLSCYVDNDPQRQKEGVIVNGKKIDVQSESYLKNLNGNDIVLLLAVSRCGNLIEKLDGYRNLDNCLCYIMPMMCIDNFRDTNVYSDIKISENAVIPKIINYIWLGGRRIPKQLEKCMDSWKRFCPDYEIVRWDENNYDLTKNSYIKEAYEEKAYGFVPDYMRLDILYNHGGIYLDTDVEIIKSLDELLFQRAFCGVEKWQTLNFGGCSGSVKGNEALKTFLNAREGNHYRYEDGKINKNTCGFIDTFSAIGLGYKLNGKLQRLSNITIYPSDFFHPYDYMSGRLEKTANTFSIHHFNGGWLSHELRKENERITKEYTLLEKRALSS